MEYLLAHLDKYVEDFKFLPPLMKDRILKRITTKCHAFSSNEMQDIFSNLIHSNLTRIDLSLYDGNVVNDKLIESLSICHNLQSLILCRETNTILTDEVLLKVLPTFKKLRVLQALNCSAINNKVIECLVEHCPNIMELDLSGCPFVYDECLIYLKDLDHLIALGLSGTPITDFGLNEFLKGSCAQILKELRIAECARISSDIINVISDTCLCLEVFVFYRCFKYSDDKSVPQFNDDNFKNLKQITWSIHW